jgi:hypothetical protein
MGARHVPRFGADRSLGRRKSPKILGRNAKTRWGEPAYQFAWSQIVNLALVEAATRARNGALFLEGVVWRLNSGMFGSVNHYWKRLCINC